MKKYICSLLLLIFLGLSSFAQYPNKHFQSNSSTQEVIGTTVDTSWGGWKVGSLTMAKSYVDTNAVNLTFLKNIPDVLVNVRDSIFKRTSDAKRWVNLSTIGNSVAPSCQGLIFGGVITLNSGLTLNVTNDQYCINGTTYTAPSTIVTLAAADPVLKRKDVIVSTTSGTTIVITGTSAVNPIEPYVDPQTQIKLGVVDIPANGTTPANITRTIIYNENVASPTEWAHTATGLTAGSVNFANTLNPYIGTISADIATGTLGTIQFTKSDTVRASTFDVFQMFIRPKAAIPDASKIEVAFTFGGNLVSSYVNIDNTKGYIKSNSGSYQNISISRASFAPMANDSIDGVLIRFTGTNSGFYLDYIQLQSGIIPPIPDYDGSYLSKRRTDSTMLGVSTNFLDSVKHITVLPATGNKLAFPSPFVLWGTNHPDTITGINYKSGIGVYSQDAPTGNPTTRPSLIFKDAVTNVKALTLTPISAAFGNGILLDGTNRIFSGTTTLYQANSTTQQHLFASGVGSALTGTMVEFDLQNTTYAKNTNIFQAKGNNVGTALVVTADKRVGIGRTPDFYSNLNVQSVGMYFLGDTMTTAQRDGINKNIISVTVTNPGSGYGGLAPVPVVFVNSPCGGLNPVLSATVSGGQVTGISVIGSQGGQCFSTSGSVTFNNAGTGGSGAAATYNVGVGVIATGAMIFNKDSLCYQSFNGTTWDNMRSGGSGGSSYTLPIASGSVLGGVKVGSNLSIDGSGVLSGAAPLVLVDGSGTTASPTSVSWGGTIAGHNVEITGAGYSTLFTSIDTFLLQANNIIFQTGAEGNGKVWTSNADGKGEWVTPSAGSGLTVGSSTITSGTDTRILFNNSGVLGEYSISGTGNVAMTTSPTFTTPALGTPSALVGTNATGFPISSAISGLASGVATFLGTPSSSNLAAAVTGETGSGALVFGTSPTLATPVINVGSDATGDLYYRNSGGAFTRLGIGSTGQVLTVASGLPSWATGGSSSFDTTKFNQDQFSFRTLTATKDSGYLVGVPTLLQVAKSDSSIGGYARLSYDSAGNTFIVGFTASLGIIALSENPGSVNYDFGDNSGLHNGLRLHIDENGSGVHKASIGDDRGLGGSTSLILDDDAQTATINATNGTTVNGSLVVSSSIQVVPTGIDAQAGIFPDGSGFLGDNNTVFNGIYYGYDQSAGHRFEGNVRMSTYGAGAATFDASGNISSVSDERLKNILGYSHTGLNAVMKLRPILYKWNGKSKNETDSTYSGFSAQNIKANIPFGTGTSKDGYLSLQDRAILSAAIVAIQELNKKLDKQAAQIKLLKSKIKNNAKSSN